MYKLHNVDIEIACEICFEQHYWVITTSASMQQFAIKQQEIQSNIPPFEQEQYCDVLRPKSNLIHSLKLTSLKSYFLTSLSFEGHL